MRHHTCPGIHAPAYMPHLRDDVREHDNRISGDIVDLSIGEVIRSLVCGFGSPVLILAEERGVDIGIGSEYGDISPALAKDEYRL